MFATNAYAMAGGADRTGMVIGIGASADNGRITNTAKLLVGHAARRRCGGQVAARIAGHGPDCSEFVGGAARSLPSRAVVVEIDAARGATASTRCQQTPMTDS